jgi:uncharacterized lipoprotein
MSETIITRFILCAVITMAILSCAASNDDQIEDIHLNYDPVKLERPPRIVDYSTMQEPAGLTADSAAEQTAGETAQQIDNPSVMLSAMAGSDTRIEIREPYSKAWSMVAKALAAKSFSVADRDRDNGLFYVKFDPDAEGSDDSAWDNIVSFLAKDQSGAGEYHLKLEQFDSAIDVTAEMVEDENIDDEDDLVDPDKSVEIFLTALFKVLREL